MEEFQSKILPFKQNEKKNKTKNYRRRKICVWMANCDACSCSAYNNPNLK